MPTYQYQCRECNYDFDVVQKFSDSALTQCPQCSGSLRKVFSPVGIVFKGSGFYSTENNTKGATSVGSSSKTTEPKSDSANTSSDSSKKSTTSSETSSSTAKN